MEHFDVLIVGAGLSGIGAACHLQARCPGKRYAVLEARGAIGGTWDLFRYPGIRSDSDMYTMGYSFRPWDNAQAIADGPAILDYIRRTARDHGIVPHIRFGHRVVGASWSSHEARWTVEVERGDKFAWSEFGRAEGDPVGVRARDGAHISKEIARFTCGFLFMCSGYYSYDQGYAPEFPGAGRFQGRIVHPQQWPDDVDYAGKRVVVIGSGATAVTLVPALARTAAQVTMVQRSPSYVMSLPGRDGLANFLRRWLPARLAYAIVRWKNVLLGMLIFQLCRRAPRLMKRLLRRGVRKALGPGYAVDTHFRPRYNPWDQRLCLVPDGDLFETIAAGRAAVVTGRIETFTAAGIRLSSGAELAADLVVTATGLKLLALGGVRLAVDGCGVDLPKTLSYKGMMLSGVPNLAYAVGYTNASWTLKCDLTCRYVCRLLKHMDRRGYRQCTPRNRDPSIREEPLIDFTSGYVLRSIHEFPKQGSKAPWRLYQNYALDLMALRFGAIEDDAMEFSGSGAATGAIQNVAG